MLTKPFKRFSFREVKKFSFKVGARSSPLSRAQVVEVQKLLGAHFEVTWVETTGDLDQKTSLRGLDKTDFFTRELDEMLLAGKIDIAIHSAKDLPNPLPKGLCATFTECLDPRDALVFRELPLGGTVATSSERREEAVRQLRPDVRFVDLRGTIGERLAKIERGEVDAVVVAEAALIRLSLTHWNRLYLPGPTAEGQGSLAIVYKEECAPFSI